MSDLKAEMTIALNTSDVKNGVKSIDTNLDSAKDSADKLGNSLEFKNADVKGMNSSLNVTKDALEDVKGNANAAGKSLEKMADTKKISFLHNAIKGCFQGIGQFVGMASLDKIKQGFVSAIHLGLEFMQQSEEGQKRVAKWQGKIEDLKKGIGELFAKALEKMEPFIDWALDAINEKVIPAVNTCAKFIYSAYTDYIYPFFEKIGQAWEEYGIPVVAGFMTAWTNGLDIVKVAFQSWILSYVKGFETVKYWITEVIPGSIAWFADIVIDNFTTIGENIKQIFSNVGKNIGDFFKAIKDVASGRGWTFQGTSLTNGMDELAVPDYKYYVQDRQKSDTEKELEKSIETTVKSISEGYEKNVQFMRDITTSVKLGIESVGQKSKEEVKDIEEPEVVDEKATTVEEPVSDGYDKSYISSYSEEDSAEPYEEQNDNSEKASTEGLSAAYERINNAVANRNPVVDVVKKQIEEQKKAAEEMKVQGNKTKEASEKTRDNTRIVAQYTAKIYDFLINGGMSAVVEG